MTWDGDTKEAYDAFKKIRQHLLNQLVFIFDGERCPILHFPLVEENMKYINGLFVVCPIKHVIKHEIQGPHPIPISLQFFDDGGFIMGNSFHVESLFPISHQDLMQTAFASRAVPFLLYLVKAKLHQQRVQLRGGVMS